MTTAAAAAMYEAEHVAMYAGRKLALFNPHGKPFNELPVIYGFNNGGNPGWMSAVLMAEDGTDLGGHLCSSEAYMPSDLGCLEGTRDDRHKTFKAHYPEGYRMEFIGWDDFDGCEGLKKAIELAKAKADPQASSPQPA